MYVVRLLKVIRYLTVLAAPWEGLIKTPESHWMENRQGMGSSIEARPLISHEMSSHISSLIVMCLDTLVLFFTSFSVTLVQ